MSIRPFCYECEDHAIMANEVGSDADDEALDGEKLVDGGERISLPRDDAVIKGEGSETPQSR